MQIIPNGNLHEKEDRNGAAREYWREKPSATPRYCSADLKIIAISICTNHHNDFWLSALYQVSKSNAESTCHGATVQKASSAEQDYCDDDQDLDDQVIGSNNHHNLMAQLFKKVPLLNIFIFSSLTW